MKTNAINWFEIFTHDINRSKGFYEKIFDTTMIDAEMEDAKMAMFPYDQENGTGGALSQMECGKPGQGGTMVYLNAEGEIDAILSRIAQAGGKVHKERTAIPPHGFIAIFEDPDGNVVGLHSMS